MKPAISIIMPMYGVETFIARAIESVQQQTFTDWELLIVNDGTKDQSREIAADYEKHDERIRIIDKPNGGLTSARLKGLEYAQGDFLSFIDSDDTLQIDYLEALYSNIVKYDADVSMCSYNTVFGSSVTPCMLYFPNVTTIIEGDTIFCDYFLPQVKSIKKNAVFLPSFMWLRLFRRDVVTNDLFVSERMVYQEDLAFSARQVNRLKRVAVINKPLYNYYVNAGSLTQKYRENAWEMMQTLTREIECAFDGHPCALTSEKSLSSVLSAVHFTLLNAARLNYNDFKKVFADIVREKSVTKTCSMISLFSIQRSFLALVIAIRFRCPSLIYNYNKKRI